MLLDGVANESAFVDFFFAFPICTHDLTGRIFFSVYKDRVICGHVPIKNMALSIMVHFYLCTHLNMHVFICACIYMRMYLYVHAFICACMYMCMHLYVHVFICACI